MGISFVSGHPALLIEKEKLVVAGDLHIGMESRFRDKGVYFSNPAEKMADELLGICRRARANGIVLLGDVKDSIMNVTKEEESALKSFFDKLNGMPIRIARGNHDSYLDKILSRNGIEVKLEKEILVRDAALLHGNAMPSQSAMEKRYVITGHSHVAASINGIDDKVWAVLKPGRGAKIYGKAGRNCRMVMVPAFNEMIIGTRLSSSARTNMPLVRREVFDIRKAEIYDLRGNKIS